MWSFFRKKHLELLLETTLSCKGSLDFLVHKHFKDNRALGSKDRVIVKQALYEIIKWKELFKAHKAETPLELIALYTSEDSPIGKDNTHLPSNVQVSIPKWLFKKIDESLGYKSAMEFCSLCNTIAPTTIRLNSNKCEKNAFYEKYKEEMLLTPCTFAKYGFHVGKRFQYDSLPEYREGHFEPQDEASQIIAETVDAKPGQHILDYCAGSGGKTLGFAPLMGGKGQVHLHDVRIKPLLDAKKRLKKAGIQNFQIYQGEENRLSTLLGHMDTVLVDAPCSCSGTFRRRPDQKWNLTESFLNEITTLQREILTNAIPFVKKGGTLIYATCSVLKEENEEQTAFLKEREDLVFLEEKIVPLTKDGSDGMYLSVFKRL